MRTSSSVVSSALFLGLAAAAAISNVADITARASIADGIGGGLGTAIGGIWGSVVPSNINNAAIQAAGGQVASPDNQGPGDASAVDVAGTGAGAAAGTTGQDVLPDDITDPGVKAAGGNPARA